jgi:hypothetical protein
MTLEVANMTELLNLPPENNDSQFSHRSMKLDDIRKELEGWATGMPRKKPFDAESAAESKRLRQLLRDSQKPDESADSWTHCDNLGTVMNPPYNESDNRVRVRLDSTAIRGIYSSYLQPYKDEVVVKNEIVLEKTINTSKFNLFKMDE